jgi:hypothetical protein
MYAMILYKNLFKLSNSKMSELKKLTHIFLSGKLSATLIIPISIARKYGLDSPTHVLVEEKEEGILIKKLEI